VRSTLRSTGTKLNLRAVLADDELLMSPPGGTTCKKSSLAWGKRLLPFGGNFLGRPPCESGGRDALHLHTAGLAQQVVVGVATSTTAGGPTVLVPVMPLPLRFAVMDLLYGA